MFIAGPLPEPGQRLDQARAPLAGHARGIGANAMILRGQQPIEQPWPHRLMRLVHADHLQQPFIVRHSQRLASQASASRITCGLGR